MAGAPKSRTIMFFKLMVEDSAGKRTASKITFSNWESGITKQLSASLADRAYDKGDDRLIGQAFTVDGSQIALRVMKPRDEDSWLALLDWAAKSTDKESAPFEAGTDRDLVETSIVAFVPGCQNVFGIIKGSNSAPTHTDVAKWLTHVFMPQPDQMFHAAHVGPMQVGQVREAFLREAALGPECPQPFAKGATALGGPLASRCRHAQRRCQRG